VHEPYAPEERAFLEVTRNAPSHRAVGCAKCEFTGFHGRLPIVDIIEIDRSLRDAVGTGESRLSVLAGLRSGGLKSLAASGSLRVISGETTVREVMDTVGPGFWPELAEHYGTYFSTDTVASIPLLVAPGFGVLLMGGDDALADQLRPALADEGLRLVHFADAEAAGGALREDGEIAFIVADLAEGMEAEAAAKVLRDNRRHISWARLPAAVLVPASLAAQQDALRESGVMAEFLLKPLNVAALLEQIRRAQAR
jgi:hypothetical protein